MRRDWAHPRHICSGTGLAPATSAPGLAGPWPTPLWSSAGCLAPITIRIPKGSLLWPSADAAVVGGNVQASALCPVRGAAAFHLGVQRTHPQVPYNPSRPRTMPHSPSPSCRLARRCDLPALMRQPCTEPQSPARCARHAQHRGRCGPRTSAAAAKHKRQPERCLRRSSSPDRPTDAAHIASAANLLACWAHPFHSCSGTRLAWRTPPTSSPGLGSPRPLRYRYWARPCHICTGTRDRRIRLSLLKVCGTATHATAIAAALASWDMSAVNFTRRRRSA